MGGSPNERTRQSTPWSSYWRRSGTRLNIGWVTQARKGGTDYRDLRIEVSGNYDLRGYLDLTWDAAHAAVARLVDAGDPGPAVSSA